jgi:repressor LexA
MARPNKDHEYLDALRRYHAAHGVLPSYGQMSTLLRFKAKHAAQRLVGRLEGNGYLARSPGGRVVPGARFHELPVLEERIPAGAPDPGALSLTERYTSLDQLLIDKREQTVLVQVRGDSMIDAGVLDGDTAIVVTDRVPRTGDFVVARIDDAYTLKELRIERGRCSLIAHNKAFAPMEPTSAVEVLGIVTGIARRLKRGRHKKSLGVA